MRRENLTAGCTRPTDGQVGAYLRVPENSYVSVGAHWLLAAKLLHECITTIVAVSQQSNAALDVSAKVVCEHVWTIGGWWGYTCKRYNSAPRATCSPEQKGPPLNTLLGCGVPDAAHSVVPQIFTLL